MNEQSRQNWLAISAIAESIKAMGPDEETEKKLDSVKAMADAALRTAPHLPRAGLAQARPRQRPHVAGQGRAVMCPHDRERKTCIRCDPWVPRDSSEADLTRWQKYVDQNRKWQMRVVFPRTTSAPHAKETT